MLQIRLQTYSGFGCERDGWSWSAYSIDYGDGFLIVRRYFPSWWGISPWASPFWKSEVTEASAPDVRRTAGQQPDH